jgi:hypothetical protein
VATVWTMATPSNSRSFAGNFAIAYVGVAKWQHRYNLPLIGSLTTTVGNPPPTGVVCVTLPGYVAS